MLLNTASLGYFLVIVTKIIGLKDNLVNTLKAWKTKTSKNSRMASIK